jgi:hypothetical protein
MKENFRSHLLLAAALILISGLAFVALAGETETKVKVMKLGDEEIKLVIDDTTEVITLEDLADGEERTFKAGDREIVVKREGDELNVTLDGEGFASHKHGHHAKSMVWVTTDGEEDDVHKIVVRTGDDEDEDVMAYHIMIDEDEIGDKIEKVIELKLDKLGAHLEELEHLDILKDIDIDIDGEPVVVKVHGDKHVLLGKHDDGKVHYRCEETGSVLVVDAEKATEDTYVCPVTGCVMERVKVPVAKRVKVMVREKDDEEEEE